ncbi:hypothetical protein [Paenibacillus solani]|uniref:Uncharacterized protein n=1 Tax=Paenibacillus solani TaxID=1705565 RepID=A0A0M1P029_9BACL|nr:hypothetical protein [Paenibacillus solani]KOR87826.1 hypothetical protein AM231_00825 [Paenibacillus solani]
MKIIGKLFDASDIKYIVSVDDCYGSSTEAVQISELIDEIVERTEDFTTYIQTIGKNEFDIDTVGYLPEELKRKQIKDWIEVLEPIEITMLMKEIVSQELITQKDTLIEFFDELKKSKIIIDYKTIESVDEAKKFLKTEISNLWSPDENNKVLWLIDRDFGKQGAENEGFNLLKEFHSEECKWNIAILATQNTEDIENEEQFNVFLEKVSDLSESKNMYWKMNKGLIDKNSDLDFANAINLGLKRNYTYRVTNFLTDALKQGIELAGNHFKNIEQSTFSNIFLNFSNDEGVSIVDTLTRVLLVLTKHNLNDKITRTYEDLVKLISDYENMAVLFPQQEIQNLSEVNEIRKKEKYNYWINDHYYPVSFGDIFSINNEEYILISQPCDITLRAKGDRKIKNGLLLKISTEKPNHGNVFPLEYFKTGETSYIDLKDELQVDLDILDLCSLNDDGCAKLIINNTDDMEVEKERHYSIGLRNRLHKVKKRITRIYKDKNLLKETLSTLADRGGADVADLVEVYHRKEKEIWEGFITINNFHDESDYIYYDVQRICRLDELVTNSLSFEHFTVSSRIGLPGDYAKQYKVMKYYINVDDPTEFFSTEKLNPLPLPEGNIFVRHTGDKKDILNEILMVVKKVAPATEDNQLKYDTNGSSIVLDSSFLPIRVKDNEHFCKLQKNSLRIPTDLISLHAKRFMKLISEQSETLWSNTSFKKFYKGKKGLVIELNESISFKKTDFINGIYSFEHDGKKLLTIMAAIEKIADFNYELVMEFYEEIDTIESLITKV